MDNVVGNVWLGRCLPVHLVAGFSSSSVAGVVSVDGADARINVWSGRLRKHRIDKTVAAWTLAPDVTAVVFESIA